MAAFFLKDRSTNKSQETKQTTAPPVRAITPMGSVETGGLGTGSPVSGLGENYDVWHWSPPATLVRLLGAHHDRGNPGAEQRVPTFYGRAERRGSSGPC